MRNDEIKNSERYMDVASSHLNRYIFASVANYETVGQTQVPSASGRGSCT